MRKLFFILLSLTTLLISCDQKDYIERRLLTKTSRDYLFYDIYQTGIDNYTFSFYSFYESDTIKIFEYYLNDAVYSALRLTLAVKGDTIQVTANMKSEENFIKLHSGTIFHFTGSK